MADNTVEDAAVTFNVKSASGPKVTVTLPLNTTVADLKSKLAEPDMTNVPASSQRLIYSGKVLKDHETLATHSVKEGNTMHLVRSAASNQRQNPASQSTPSSTSTNEQNIPPTGVPQNFAAGTGNDPLAGITGARYAGMHAGLPSLQSLANPPSAEDIPRLLEDPNFAQQMNEALSNPQMIDMMINMNPQLRALGPQARQMLQSDGFRRMLTNPDAMRSMMQMQRMMGNNPLGGGGQEAFAMPGSTTTTDTQHQNQGEGQNQQPQGQQQNPFGNMFGAGGMNPMMFMPPPPVGSDRSADPNAAQTNPFAAMFNPAMFGQPQGQGQGQQTGQTDVNTPGSGQTDPSSAASPFPGNPGLGNMMNNPMMQQMLNNPEAMRQAMQMLTGGAGGDGGMGGIDPFAAFGGGGFGQPADNRPPEERFATQLRQLNEMGFFNYDQNIQSLTRSGGDVNGALEWLFSQPPS